MFDYGIGNSQEIICRFQTSGKILTCSKVRKALPCLGGPSVSVERAADCLATRHGPGMRGWHLVLAGQQWGNSTNRYPAILPFWSTG